MNNFNTHTSLALGKAQEAAMKTQQMEIARNNMHCEIKNLIAINDDELHLQWTGHKVDLIEAAYDTYLLAHLTDNNGQPATFTWIVNRLFHVLHVDVPRNPWATLSKLRHRKNVRQAPFLERYRWALFEAEVPHPMRMLIIVRPAKP